MKRYSLRAMLVVATLFAIFFGYSQHRRRTIVQECEALKADQVQFVLSDTWMDRVWQRSPTNICVMVSLKGGYDPVEERARKRLDRLGLKYDLMGEVQPPLN